MQTQEIIKIWKEVIYISWYYKNYESSQKSKIENHLLKYKEKLYWSENPYSKRITIFIDDLLDDLSKNRPLEIDKIFEDDFVWNYYDTILQNKIYNNLIDFEVYRKIFDELEKDKNFEEFYLNFSKNFKKLDAKIISKNLLIFTIFEIIPVKKYLNRLWIFRKKLNFSSTSIKNLEKILLSYNNFIEKIYKIWLKNLKEKIFSYKYIKIDKIWEEKDFELKFNLFDASRQKFRTWDILFEYKEVLKNLYKK